MGHDRRNWGLQSAAAQIHKTAFPHTQFPPTTKQKRPLLAGPAVHIPDRQTIVHTLGRAPARPSPAPHAPFPAPPPLPAPSPLPCRGGRTAAPSTVAKRERVNGTGLWLLQTKCAPRTPVCHGVLARGVWQPFCSLALCSNRVHEAHSHVRMCCLPQPTTFKPDDCCRVTP